MPVSRTLPQKKRSLVGSWCFIDHYGPDDVSESSDCAADAGASGPERPTAPSAMAATEAVAMASGLRHWARTDVRAVFCLGFT